MRDMPANPAILVTAAACMTLFLNACGKTPTVTHDVRATPVKREFPANAVVGGVHISARVTPGKIRSGKSDFITYRLKFRTGGSAQRFWVRVIGPPGREATSTPISLRRTTVIGGGRLLESGIGMGEIDQCVKPHGFTRTTVQSGGSYKLALKAHSESVLVSKYEIGSFPISPVDDLRVIYKLGDIPGYSGPNTLGGSARLASPQPAPIGRLGVTIDLQVNGRETGETIDSEIAVSISGGIRPPAAGRLVNLRYSAPAMAPFPFSFDRMTLIARLKTAANGSFRLRNWTPPGRNNYFVWAEAPSNGTTSATDWACPINIAVR